MKRQAFGHTKMKRLCRSMKLPQWQVVGLLESLWALCARETPHGNIGKLSDEDIADALEYEGDPHELTRAMVECGWLDASEKQRLLVHDWAEHADDAINMRLARAGETFADGRIPKLTRLAGKEKARALAHYGSEKEGPGHKGMPTVESPTVCSSSALPESRRSHHQSRSQSPALPGASGLHSASRTSSRVSDSTKVEAFRLARPRSVENENFLRGLDDYEPREQLKRIYQGKHKSHALPTVALLDAIETKLLAKGVTLDKFVHELRTNHLGGDWANPPGLLSALAEDFGSLTVKVEAPETLAESQERNYRCPECSSRKRGEGLLKDGGGAMRPCSCASPEYIARMCGKGVLHGSDPV